MTDFEKLQSLCYFTLRPLSTEEIDSLVGVPDTADCTAFGANDSLAVVVGLHKTGQVWTFPK